MAAAPPYYAILLHLPAPGADPRLHRDTVERLIGLAAAEPGFLGVETAQDGVGGSFTVCYWRTAAALRRWQRDAVAEVPATLPAATVIGPVGCLWPWLGSVQEASRRRPAAFEVPMYDAPDPPAEPAGNRPPRTA